MLDALVAEARLRWGSDLADGLQVIPAERLIGIPLDASRPAPCRTARHPAGGPGGRGCWAAWCLDRALARP